MCITARNIIHIQKNTPKKKKNDKTAQNKRYMCMKYHLHIQSKFQCVSCDLYVDMHLCKHYDMVTMTTNNMQFQDVYNM